mgnify:CR=1 FL=1|jgi:hypothetical protein
MYAQPGAAIRVLTLAARMRNWGSKRQPTTSPGFDVSRTRADPTVHPIHVEDSPVAGVETDQDRVGKTRLCADDAGAHASDGGELAHIARGQSHAVSLKVLDFVGSQGQRNVWLSPAPVEVRMARLGSAVTMRSSFRPGMPTRICSRLLVSSATRAGRLPPGELWLTRSGLPNCTSRGISGGSSASELRETTNLEKAARATRGTRDGLVLQVRPRPGIDSADLQVRVLVRPPKPGAFPFLSPGFRNPRETPLSPGHSVSGTPDIPPSVRGCPKPETHAASRRDMERTCSRTAVGYAVLL